MSDFDLVRRWLRTGNKGKPPRSVLRAAQRLALRCDGLGVPAGLSPYLRALLRI